MFKRQLTNIIQSTRKMLDARPGEIERIQNRKIKIQSASYDCCDKMSELKFCYLYKLNPFLKTACEALCLLMFRG